MRKYKSYKIFSNFFFYNVKKNCLVSDFILLFNQLYHYQAYLELIKNICIWQYNWYSRHNYTFSDFLLFCKSLSYYTK